MSLFENIKKALGVSSVPTVDPALKAQLEKRGMQTKVAELERPGIPGSSLLSTIGKAASPVRIPAGAAAPAKAVAGFAQSIPQATARAVVAPALDVVGGVTGQVNPKTLASTAEIKPTNVFLRALFGPETVKSRSQRGVKAEEFGRKHAGMAGAVAAPLVLAGLEALDLTPFAGGTGKKAAAEGAGFVAKTVGKEAAEEAAKAGKSVFGALLTKKPRLPAELRAELPTFGEAKREVGAVAKYLSQAKNKYLQAFLRSGEGAREVETAAVKSGMAPTVDSTLVNAIKSNQSFRKEGTLRDAMAEGVLMKSGDKVVIAAPDEIEAFAARGYAKGIGVDRLAQEAGYDDPFKFLEDTLSAEAKAKEAARIPKTPEKIAERELLRNDENYRALVQKAEETREAVKALPPPSSADLLKRGAVERLAADIYGPLTKETARLRKANPAVLELPGPMDAAAALADAERVVAPIPKPKRGLAEAWNAIKGGVSKAETKLVSEFTPLRKAEEELYSARGLDRPKLDMARKFEQVAGAAGKAEADIHVFERTVIAPVKKNAEDLNTYLFLKRTEDRLIHDPAVKRVGSWTEEKAAAALAALRSKVGEETFARIESTAKNGYQAVMDESLRLQVAAGRMTKGAYEAIKASNDFYAPFKVMKHLEGMEGVVGTGRKIATTKQLTKAITGITDDDFKLGNILQASAEQIYKSRILAEKNLKMLELEKLADLDLTGKLISRVASDAGKPAAGFERVAFFKDGERIAMDVRKDVAKAVQGLTPPEAGLVSKVMQTAAMPFRWGTTGANAGFQIVNYLLADTPRLLIMSKYGVRSPADIVRFPLDMAYGLFTSLKGNVFGRPNELFMEWLRSGAANSTISREIRPEAFKKTFGIEKNIVKGLSQKASTGVLDTVAKLSNAVEEATKITGLKRAMRFERLERLSPEARAEKMAEIATEVRNFVGSPDFARRGTGTKQANLLFMFLNARIQGTTGDLARLAGLTGVKEAAAAQGRLAVMVGIPALGLAVLNNTSEYKADYDKLPQWEKDNYFMIPRDSFFINDDGNRVREYWRVPKRETVKLYANLIESSYRFAQEKDPAALAQYGVSFLENISPIGIEGETLGERALSVAGSMNPLVKEPLEQATGKDFFRKADIIPRSLAEASPALQYKKTTPELYKKIGAALGVSPLRLEHVVGGVTGGGVKQFLSKPQPAGRSALASNPVLSRFVSSGQVNQDEAWREIDEATRRETDRRLTLRRDAETATDELLAMPREQGRARFDEIAKENFALAKKIKDTIEERNLGLTAVDRALKDRSVLERANIIFGHLQKLPADARRSYYQEMLDKKIITKEVGAELRKRLAGAQ